MGRSDKQQNETKTMIRLREKKTSQVWLKKNGVER